MSLYKTYINSSLQILNSITFFFNFPIICMYSYFSNLLSVYSFNLFCLTSFLFISLFVSFISLTNRVSYPAVDISVDTAAPEMHAASPIHAECPAHWPCFLSNNFLRLQATGYGHLYSDYCYVRSALSILFHCVVFCIVCV